jgi:uncharacterized coiled-coil protein SlyX
MSSVHAVTDDIRFDARIASFYELNDATQKDILNELTKTFVELGKKHDFLVWRVQIHGEKK